MNFKNIPSLLLLVALTRTVAAQDPPPADKIESVDKAESADQTAPSDKTAPSAKAAPTELATPTDKTAGDKTPEEPPLDENDLSLTDPENIPAQPSPMTGPAEESVPLPVAKPAKPGEPIYTEMILDSSGSMLAEVKGETKIKSAKKMVAAFIKELEEKNSLVAVRTFGSRDGTCKDLLLKLDFYKKDEAKLSQIVGEINPHNRARTPLAKAMEDAYKHLKDKQGRKNLVVFTDGKETCQGKPCEVAKKLFKKLDIKIYLVAYGVKKKKEFREMKCIADETNGKAIAPQGPLQLAQALAQVQRDIKQTQQGVIVQGPDPTAPASATAVTGGESKEFISGMGTELKPGTYNISIQYSSNYVFKKVVVQKNQLKVLRVNGNGNLKAEFVHPLMLVEVMNIDTQAKFKFSQDVEDKLSLPSGRYTIIAKTATGLAYQWPTQMIVPNATSKLSTPPWGILLYRSQNPQPIRLFKREAKTASAGELLKEEKGKLPIRELIREQAPDVVGTTNQEIFLEEGTYVAAFPNGALDSDIKIQRGKRVEKP